MVGRPSSDEVLRPPSGLKSPGRRLWVAVVGKYVLTPGEIEMLGQAARTADELDRLERGVRALPELTTTGSTGQIRPHPLLAEVRAHRQLLERLTTALNLPDDTQEVGVRAASRHAQKAARGRWRPTKAGDGVGDASTPAWRTDAG